MGAEADTRGASYVLFRLGKEEYGVGIDRVRSIIRYEEPTVVPRSPESVRGVVNLRGKVIPVIDLAKRLELGVFEPGPMARIVVADAAVGLVGLVVDAASEVVAIPEDSIRPTPEGAVTAEAAAMFAGVAEVQGRLVILLELDVAIPKSEYAHMGGDLIARED